MPVRVALQHKTEYVYDKPVMLSPQVVRLRPAPHCRTAIRSYSLKVDPPEHFLNWQQDAFSNHLARLVVPEATRRFCVEVDLVAEMVVVNPFDFFLDDYALEFPFQYQESELEDLRPYLRKGEPGPLFAAYLEKIDCSRRHTLEFLVNINQRLQNDIQYLIREEPGVQTPEETLGLGCGSCRDSAWLLVQLLRHCGLAARFVSGYLIQLAADEAPLEGPAGPASDFTDLHAWTEVYLPGAGWVGLDPTSGLLAGEGHLPLACSPEPSSAAPITGATEKAEVRFSFEMDVQRVHETPRVSRPFSEEEWRAIDSLGEQVEQRLQQMDVRLTMGGEPTFVSADDRNSEEWHTAALGEQKRQLGLDMLQALSLRFGPKGLHHHGQGKWYPGESLPRWSLDCYWRRDGIPLWRDAKLRADAKRDYGHTAVDAGQLMDALCKELAVSRDYANAAYEDVFYYLWRERRLPVNVDPFESKLDDAEERARLMRVFSAGLDNLAGYALPIRPIATSSGWQWESGAWFMRAERMYLMPGDSPMGLRLPLDSLPWEVEGERQFTNSPDPMSYPSRAGQQAPLVEVRRQSPSRWHPATHAYTPLGQAPMTSSAWSAEKNLPANIVRTALCIEPRNGRLHVFMPPMPSADAYFTLIHAVERAASATRLPVVIEGYTPPWHPDVLSFSIRPDPGVLEINVQPCGNWAELRELSTILYDEARKCRLSAEKYALDGRATGTGGGGHVVLGGPTAVDSPFLRRPDLLRSMLGFWHNHPGLSYLFTGLFVGATSQAPRVDEARNDMVAELELAFAQADAQEPAPPWLVDRLFRNLLVDVTGNTHRAEFCIDKLFAPESAEGRRGLLEMRAFEMPPHPRMALLQGLLIRAIVAAFWERPYEERLVRWHTGLHDRFMLPHFIWTDFTDVLHTLRVRGYDFRPEWFSPQCTFRFPKYGEIAHDGVHLELCAALEPWPVLGEEPLAGGTTRYVDSSLDRVQVKVRGLIDGRHVVACNGVRVPLHPTGTVGEYVAGIRYRAWRLAEALHPTILPHTPLIFDVIDSWNSRSLGGCTLWASHPGGRSYEHYPVNANEAEARRHVRFAPIGHSHGLVHLREPAMNPEYPMTLDLRHC